MSRPEFPRCILPVACIRAILAKQDAYDRDPEEYGRWERIREETRQREQEQEEQYWQQEAEQIERDE